MDCGKSKMKLKWGICGAGQISNDFCHAVKSLPQDEHEITAIASRSDERAQSYAEKFQIRRTYTKYGDLASDSEIDIVYIGTWHITHVHLIKMMLNAGKHVLCETPIAFTTDEVREVFELAREKNRFLMEAFWSRTFEIYAEIKKAIQKGDIGEVKLVTANLGYPDPLRTVEEGGGVLMEIGIYLIQFVNWIFNNENPECIKAIGSIGEKGCDEDGCVIMAYKNGGKASFMYTMKCSAVNSGCIFGTEGQIVIPDNMWCPEEAILPSGKICYPLQPKDPSVYNFPNSLGLRNEASLVRQCIMKGVTECPVMTYEDSLSLHIITDEVKDQIGLKYDSSMWVNLVE